MELCVFSDIHGYLPNNIKQCDVVCICGDIFPLKIQRNSQECKDWWENEFTNWVLKLPCKKVIVIAGNHDFWFDYYTPSAIRDFIRNSKLKGKLIYLHNKSYRYKGITFYGCPYCEGPYGWAFSPCDTMPDIHWAYDKIKDCDVLLTHQPPKIGHIGCSYPGKPWQRDFGSEYLADILRKKDISYLFCGHVHTGNHLETNISDIFFTKTTKMFNVSLLDEDYNVTFEPKYITL